MAAEITEFGGVRLAQGSAVPAPVLPYGKHSQLALGSTLTVQDSTLLVRILPGEDCRVNVTSDGSGPPDPAASATAMLLKSGVSRDFAVRKGIKIRVAAA